MWILWVLASAKNLFFTNFMIGYFILVIDTWLIMSLLPFLHPAGKGNALQSSVTIRNEFYNEIMASGKWIKEGNTINFPLKIRRLSESMQVSTV